ncbi:MAG: zinc-ribbon domain-containing protein [Lachnospiraceae bacterium]|nr:zinc-ribbon domain-containing protein [Lachnospiraceae bacterium]
MYCTNCNNQLPEGSEFCPVCGAKQLKIVEPVVKVPSKAKKKSNVPMIIISLILVVAVVVLFLFPGISPFSKGSLAGGSNRVEGRGANSPEEVLENYLEAMKNGDIDAMLACCAVESVVDNMDPEKVIDRSQVLSPYSQIYVNNGDVMRKINIENRRGWLTKEIYRQLFRLQDKDATFYGMVIAASEFDSIDDMIDEYFPSKTDRILPSIECKDTITLEKILRLRGEKVNDSIEKNIKINKKIYGCEEYYPLAIEFECDGEDFYIGADLVKYDSKWYIGDFSGIISLLAGAGVNQGGVLLESDFD